MYSSSSKWQSLLELKFGNQYEVVLIMVAEIEVAAALFYLLDLFYLPGSLYFASEIVTGINF